MAANAGQPFPVPSSSPPAMTPPDQLTETLRQSGQLHLLAFWDTLSTEGRSRLASQLEGLDWNQISDCRQRAAQRREQQEPSAPIDLSSAHTPPCHRLGEATDAATAARARGHEALAAGTVGAILVAGGQGTRLGFDAPKGTFPIGPLSHATLFEILLGKLAAVRRRHGKPVPLAIMTSNATDAATRAFLESKQHCGLNADDVFIFCQGTLPAIADDADCLLLDAPDHVAVAPDGHGGMLGALAASGGLAWFGERGCQTIVSFQVDNPLAQPLDAEFLGQHLLTAADFSTQVIPKRHPEERVGVVVERDGVTEVVEYSDLPAALASERRDDGRLRFDAGSIAIHAFDRRFLERTAAAADSLPLHLAHKKVPHLDEIGTVIEPTEPNAFKFERFIFDLMPLANRVTLIEVDPAESFAPLKNPAGSSSDSPELVQQALSDYARRHLAAAGISVAPEVTVELDAASILDDTDLVQLADSGKLPGNRIDQPLIVRAG